MRITTELTHDGYYQINVHAPGQFCGLVHEEGELSQFATIECCSPTASLTFYFHGAEELQRLAELAATLAKKMGLGDTVAIR